MKAGLYLYAAGSMAAGILDILWREFEPAHQPIQAWGDLPAITAFAFIAAFWLLLGGAALLWPSSRRPGAIALTLLYGLFVLFPLPRLYTAPHYLGHHLGVYMGVTGSVCEELVLFVAGAMLWNSLPRSVPSRPHTGPGASADLNPLPAAPPSRLISLLLRVAFGLCPVFFGLANLTGLDKVVAMIPKSMPLGAPFWAVLTAVAFLLAGLAILTGILDVLAAQLLGLMLLCFSAIALAPLIFSTPHSHVAWGGNAYNLTVVGAAWIAAEWLASQKQAPAPRLTQP